MSQALFMKYEHQIKIDAHSFSVPANMIYVEGSLLIKPNLHIDTIGEILITDEPKIFLDDAAEKEFESLKDNSLISDGELPDNILAWAKLNSDVVPSEKYLKELYSKLIGSVPFEYVEKFRQFKSDPATFGIFSPDPQFILTYELKEYGTHRDLTITIETMLEAQEKYTKLNELEMERVQVKVFSPFIDLLRRVNDDPSILISLSNYVTNLMEQK